MRHAQLLRTALKGMVPFQPQLRRLKRRFRPYEDNPANSDYCITNGLEQIAALRQAGVPLAGAEVLEFGSGWLPLIPLLFHLAGARRLVLTDVERLMDEQTIARAKRILIGQMHRIAEVVGGQREQLMARLDEAFQPEYHVPWNARAHPAASVDLILSRATFEHVPVSALRFFLEEFHRILRPGGVMCHVVDNSDHWQHKDRNLSRVSFLRYEDEDWRWRLAQSNLQAFQNRLRHSDYLQLFLDAGFLIERTTGEPDVACLQDLQEMRLARKFASRSPRDLAILTSLFVVRKAAGASLPLPARDSMRESA